MTAVLGAQVSAPKNYSPNILEPIDRAPARAMLPDDVVRLMSGADVWHLYELSWLDERGHAQQFVGVLTIPMDSPNSVESKSLKLYLNSLNFHRFASTDEALSCIKSDLRSLLGAPVTLTVLPPSDITSITVEPSGECIDDRSLVARGESGLRVVEPASEVGEVLVSHRLRSLCPVTGQPDWGTLVVDYNGSKIDRDSLVSYIDQYREHADFHEQCVERVFADLLQVAAPSRLTVVAFYQRRGGIDITPWRSTIASESPLTRMGRQ